MTFGSSHSLRTGGVMLSFICFMAILFTAASLIPGAMSLKLSPQGFTIRNWFRDETFRWTDVKEFRLITYRYMGFIPIRRQVGFKFSDTYKRNVLRKIAGALVSFDRILPDNFGMKAQQWRPCWKPPAFKPWPTRQTDMRSHRTRPTVTQSRRNQSCRSRGQGKTTKYHEGWIESSFV